jgi:hypothetical protein
LTTDLKSRLLAAGEDASPQPSVVLILFVVESIYNSLTIREHFLRCRAFTCASGRIEKSWPIKKIVSRLFKLFIVNKKEYCSKLYLMRY